MFRTLTLIAMSVLGLSFFASCASAPPPFGTSYEAARGFKARTFVGTSEEVRPAVIASLRDLGFEVHSDAEDRAYITAQQGMSAGASEGDPGRRSWLRVEVAVRQVDMHRRAPRTLVELEAENMKGNSGGPIEASFEAVQTTFYDQFFQQLGTRVPAAPAPTAFTF
ncbi:MAG: hypothetical protein PVJ89_08870 [Planctomycetota bacterium]|jgi:hypothetical protein